MADTIGSRRLLSRLIAASFIGFVCSDPILAEETNSKPLKARVDEIFSQWDKPESPGCALTIINQGRVVYECGYGVEHLDSGTPITPVTVFDIGSMSKQFTAACVVLLAESGKLSLDDDIRKYLPEFRDYGHTITIRHLIHHTSGIRDYTWLKLFARAKFPDEEKQKRQGLFDLLTRQRGLYFAPGEDHYYSNSNYFLLGIIVERVAGISLGEFAARQIFEPLGMRHTLIQQDRAQAIENRAAGYVQNVDGEFERKRDGIVFGAGSVNSTVKDLFLWDQNFIENRIGGPQFNATMLTRGKLNNGKTIKYACGLESGEYKGLQTVGFMGYTEAFATYMVRFPKQEFSIICLANLGSIRPRDLAMKVADIYLADHIEVNEGPTRPEPARQVAISLNPSAYDAYVGDYRFDFGLLMSFTRKDDRLLMCAGKQPQVELLPESKTRFFIKGADVKVSFDVDENGTATGLTLDQKGNKMVAKRVGANATLPPERLKEFAGEYFNDELQVTYTVVLNEDRLMVTAPRAFEFGMRRVENDQFAMSRGDMIFRRNEQGEVAGFLLDVKTERLSFEFERVAGQ